MRFIYSRGCGSICGGFCGEDFIYPRTMPETKTRVRKKLFPSTQLLMTTVFLDVATIFLLVLAWAPIGSFETAIVLLLVAHALGIITASIAFICAMVGFFKFARYRIINIILALVSIVINPLTLGFIILSQNN